MTTSTRRPALVWPAIALAVLAAACGGDDRTRAAAVPGADAYPLPAARVKCPRTGHWDACTLRERLDAAGLVPRDTADTVRQSFLAVGGARILLGRDELVAFLYADTGAMRRDARALDSLAAAPRGAGAPWRRPPTLILSDNLLAVLLGGDDHKIERVTLAITAGPPQPDSAAR